MTVLLSYERTEKNVKCALMCKLTGNTLHDVELIRGWDERPNPSNIALACGIAALKHLNQHPLCVAALGSQFLQFQEFQRIVRDDPRAYELELSGMRVYLHVSSGVWGEGGGGRLGSMALLLMCVCRRGARMSFKLLF